MKLWHIILVIILALSVVVGATMWSRIHKTYIFVDLATHFTAKQTCSCLYVSQRSIQSCLKDLPSESVESLKIVTTKTGVKVSAFGLVNAEAVHKPGLGCQLKK